MAGAAPALWPIVRDALDGSCTPAFAVDMRGILEAVARDRPALLLLCSNPLDVSAPACLARVRERYPELPVLVIEGREIPPDVVRRAPDKNLIGVSERDVPQHLAGAVANLLAARCRRVTRTESPTAPAERPMVLGNSPAMRKVFDMLHRVARVDVTVLLLGETGCGKELLARRLHGASARAMAPFRAVNLPAVPKDLFESVLFGHERGAFTGAVTQSAGAFAQAAGGTLFLDEVSSLALECQPKLLRAIQEREIERVGAPAPTPCDVRIVAATNVDLAGAAKTGTFRLDLYHRLSAVTIEIPPLRERPEDIPPLVEFFVHDYARRFRIQRPEVSADAMRALVRHEWGGNVRELENCVQKALVLSDRPMLRPEDFFTEARREEVGEVFGEVSGVCFGRYDFNLSEIECVYIEQVVAQHEGNLSRAAEILGIDRKTLRSKLSKTTKRFGCLPVAPPARCVERCGK